MSEVEKVVLDKDAGLIIKFGENDTQVIMRCGHPGTYFYQDGSPAPEEAARAAGFDVDADRKQLDINEKVAAFKRQLEQVAAQGVAEIQSGGSPEAKAPAPPDGSGEAKGKSGGGGASATK